MKINPVIGVIIGIALIVAGVVTRLVSFDISGAFVLLVSVYAILRDRRSGGSAS